MASPERVRRNAPWLLAGTSVFLQLLGWVGWLQVLVHGLGSVGALEVVLMLFACTGAGIVLFDAGRFYWRVALGIDGPLGGLLMEGNSCLLLFPVSVAVSLMLMLPGFCLLQPPVKSRPVEQTQLVGNGPPRSS